MTSKPPGPSLQQIYHGSEEARWIAAINACQEAPIEAARKTYEDFLKLYPTAGRYWVWYAEHEYKEGNYENVAKILDRCLMGVPSVDLWKFKLRFTEAIKLDIPDDLDTEATAEARKEVLQAFDEATEQMGSSVHAGPVWAAAIKFVNGAEDQDAFHLGQKVTALRKLYHKALLVPMHYMEELWKEYDEFETGLNPTLVRAVAGAVAGERRRGRAAEGAEGTEQESVGCPPPRG